jgi:hypothetical protein
MNRGESDQGAAVPTRTRREKKAAAARAVARRPERVLADSRLEDWVRREVRARVAKAIPRIARAGVARYLERRLEV